jgi:hypothetical protein
MRRPLSVSIALLCCAIFFSAILVEAQRLKHGTSTNARRDAESEDSLSRSNALNGLKDILSDTKRFDEHREDTTFSRGSKARLYRNSANDVPVFTNLLAFEEAIVNAKAENTDGLLSQVEGGYIVIAANRSEVTVSETATIEVEGKFYPLVKVRSASGRPGWVPASWLYQ